MVTDSASLKNSEIGKNDQSIDTRSGLRIHASQGDAILFASSKTKSSQYTENNNVNNGNPEASNTNRNSPAGNSGGETVYHAAMEQDPTVHLPGISVGPGYPVGGYPSSHPNVGVGARSGGGGNGGSAPVQNNSHSNPASAAEGRTKVSWQESSKETYDNLYDENTRNAKIGDHDTGAVAIGENSGSDPDGSIWSRERIIFHTEKGTFFAVPSVPEDVVVARFVDGNLEVTTQTPA
ncbi:hypothetical protein [Methylobacterium sp. P5_C11]